MAKVFPCYSTSDSKLAQELAEFLERGMSAEVLLEEGEMRPGDDLVSKVEQGLACDVVLMLLAPESVPGRWILERWKSVFWDQAAEMGTALGTVLCRDSKFPDLLRRKNFFDLRHNRLAGFRGIKRWLMGLSPAAQKPPFRPARIPTFKGRDEEVETLGRMLADAPGRAVVEGPPQCGKTALALEFARRHHEDFDAVFWLTCGSRSAASLAGDLAAQFAVRLDRDLESNLNELRRLCSQHRCLLILDDAALPAAALLAQWGRTSTLITTRQADLAAGLSAPALSLNEISSRTEQIAETIRKLDGAEQRLICAMCACAESGFPLDMALRTADAELQESQDMVAWFLSKDVLMPLDDHGPRFLVTGTARERVALRGDGGRWARHHALAVAELFGSQSAEGPDLTAYWPDLQHAFRRSLERDWATACKLARRGLAWAKAQDRLAEAFEILEDWSRAAIEKGDRRVLEDCSWEQVWILEHWGRDAEARALDDVRRERYADQMSLSFD